MVLIFDVDCYGNNNGRISEKDPILGGSVTGGSPNTSNPLYNYTWNPTGTGVGRTVNNLTVSTYTLSVMDSEGCVKIDTFEVSQPDLLTINITENNGILYLFKC